MMGYDVIICSKENVKENKFHSIIMNKSPLVCMICRMEMALYKQIFCENQALW